ncbi:MAG TPA: BolA family protein [Burkholderiales bacterium]|jgi:BolA protein|nr:BolA family protein [Burkholderiales bacterium]
MMATAEPVEVRIRERLAALEPERIEIRDDSGKHAGHEGAKGGGGHFSLVIVSRRFSGASVQARHRMVYDALGAMMQREIHALAIAARAPEEVDGSQREENTE